MKAMMTHEQLKQAVCPHAQGWPAARVCCDAFSLEPTSRVSGNVVSRAEVLRVHSIRLGEDRKEEKAHILGADRALSDLQRSTASAFVLTSLLSDGLAYMLFLDAETRSLVTCMVSVDHRLRTALPQELLNLIPS
jgi:hypothetical protein